MAEAKTRSPGRPLQLALLLALALSHGLLYALLIPPWQAPDEIAHFEYSRLLAERRWLLTAEDSSPALERAIIQSLYDFDAYRFVRRPPPEQPPERLDQLPVFGSSRTFPWRPSLAYVPYALAVLPFLGVSVTAQLYLMRLVSVMISAATVGVAFLTARRVAPAAPELAVGAAAVVLFWPQHAFLMASVNDGNLTQLLTAVAVFAALTLVQDGFAWRRVVIALLAAAGAILSKSTGFFLIPLFALLGLWLLGRAAWNSRWSRRRWLAVALGLLLTIAAGGLYLARNSYVQTILNNWRLHEAGSGAIITGRLGDLHLLQVVIWPSFKSFVAYFGWLTLPFDEYVYVIVCACLAISAVNLALSGWRLLCQSGLWPMMWLAAALSLVLIAWWLPVALYPEGISFFQGRFWFTAMLPFAIFVSAGWLGQARSPRRALAFQVTGLALLDSAALFALALPYYYA